MDRTLSGVKAITAFLNETRDVPLSEPQVFYRLEKGYLSGTKRGRLWEATPRQLLGPPPPRKTNRQG